VQADFENREPKLFAFDKTSGAVVAEIELPGNATGGPMTYLSNGRQFIVVPTGGANLPAELVALALP
jgi:quinoprotein glucose dehydrogenase